ncbi:hypothetical protein [Pseudorhodoplanes sp.]|uniref:hypothetical protein n=1 Tax=Pseudorhodoplanes sp. TaxID=1934341 RepID=UPI002CC9469B|nr:hypothetical protein [Pseudorhodoplanes sp.]HWV51021.1 hypothetical protein [Pseudorhodoplanes sp.]
MYILAIIAVGMAVIHLVAGFQRPRLAVAVSGLLWALYAYYEHLVASGVLCEADCNIRVDLVFFLPILALATYWAYQSYMGRPGPQKVAATALGIIGLFALGLVAEGFGYKYLSYAAILGILAIVGYAIKSKLVTKRP